MRRKDDNLIKKLYEEKSNAVISNFLEKKSRNVQNSILIPIQ